MKQLNLTKPHLFIMAGIPGAGKTYFADHFSNTYGLPLISNTHTTQILFEKPDYSDNEQTIVQRLNLSNLNELLKTQNHIIYDGYSDTRISRYDIAKLAHAFGYTPLIIWVQTDIESASRRATTSSKNYQPMSSDRFEKLVRKFTAPNEKERQIVISGKHLPSSQTRNVVNKLQIK